jgi:hypothetical protein
MNFLLCELIKMTITHIPLLAAMQEASSGPRRHEIYQSPFYIWLHKQLVELLQNTMEEQKLKECNPTLISYTLLASLEPLLAHKKCKVWFCLPTHQTLHPLNWRLPR